ncbi:MAG: lysophospholipid acyltransferase family protein [Pseudomonadota bacterium]
MQYIRSFIFSFYMILSILFFSSLILLIFFIPYKKRTFITRFWAQTNLFILEKICNLKVEISGLENIPDEPCIVFSKHQSTLETIVLQIIFTPQVWVLKRELLWIPFFGWILALGRPIAINRSSGKKAINQIIEQGIDRLKHKYWLIIFPEGTRTKPGRKIKYKAGGAILAEKSGYDILPVCHNAGQFWPKGQFLKSPGVARFIIGPVIKNNNYSSKKLLASSEEWIESSYQSLHK